MTGFLVDDVDGAVAAVGRAAHLDRALRSAPSGGGPVRRRADGRRRTSTAYAEVLRLRTCAD